MTVGEQTEKDCGPTDAENQVKDIMQMLFDSVERAKADRRTTPENVECRTCGGSGVLGASSAGGWQRCPDCTPENVEEPCPTCGGACYIADHSTGCDGRCGGACGGGGVQRCPSCTANGRSTGKRTPDNVECPTCGDLGVTGHPTSEYPYYTPCPHCTPDNVDTPGGQQ